MTRQTLENQAAVAVPLAETTMQRLHNYAKFVGVTPEHLAALILTDAIDTAKVKAVLSDGGKMDAHKIGDSPDVVRRVLFVNVIADIREAGTW
jgi:hypothetical protein